MPMNHATSVAVHWFEGTNQGAVSEATVEVQFANGDKQFLNVQILSTSPRYKPNQVPTQFKAVETEQDSPLGYRGVPTSPYKREGD